MASDVSGRLPLLKHKKALIINTTVWVERSYDDGLRAAMKKLIDEYSLIFPGVQLCSAVATRRRPARTRDGERVSW